MLVMSLRILVLLLGLALVPSAWAQEQAFTNRSTELKERGAADARAVGTLAENTEVKVLARSGGLARGGAGGGGGFWNVVPLRFSWTVQWKRRGGGCLSSTSH